MRGRTRSGYRPEVWADQVQFLRHGKLPAPLPASFDQLIRHGLSVFAKILQQPANPGKIRGHPARKRQHPQGAAKDQPVPSAQHPDDVIRVLWYKSVHGVPLLWAMFLDKNIDLTSGLHFLRKPRHDAVNATEVKT